ncbi:MAG TPA: hypothetical protein GX747_04665 [Tenericutes bacterium]|nr:hypothetical protein [Mycoplasmatota bacterium]
MNELINTASSVGEYLGLTTEMTTEAVVTQLVDDLNITKSADRDSWATGNLTYTITIDNQSEEPYENPIVTDTIDPTKATLVDGSVTINGTPATTPTDYTFDAITGLLTVNLSDVAATSTTVIVFEVERV